MTVLQTGTVTGVTVHHQAQDKRALNQTRWEIVTTAPDNTHRFVSMITRSTPPHSHRDRATVNMVMEMHTIFQNQFSQQ